MNRPDQHAPHSAPRHRSEASPPPHRRRLAAALTFALLAALAPVGAVGASADELPPSPTASEVLSPEADGAAYAAAAEAAAAAAQVPAAETPAAETPATETPATETPATENPAAEFGAPALVTGTGTSGSITVPVTPGLTGQIDLVASGLAEGTRVPNPNDPASPITGSISGIDQQSFVVSLPGLLVLSRFEIELSNPAADVDLSVFRADGVGGPVGTPAEPGPTASEAQEVFVLTDTAEFRVVVRSFGPATDFVLRSFGATVVGDVGTPTVAPAALAGEADVPTSFTYSWSDLPPGSVYVGAIGYGFGGGIERYTTVRIDTTQDSAPIAPANIRPPAINGQAEVGRRLHVNTGEWDTADLTFSYQWQSDGVDIPGATTARYRVTDADRGSALSATVTARTADGAAAAASAAAVVVKYASETSVWLSRSTASVGEEITIEVQVTSDGPLSGAATMSVGDSRYDVTLNDHGYGELTLNDLARGGYKVTAAYAGNDVVAGSTSGGQRLRIAR